MPSTTVPVLRFRTAEYEAYRAGSDTAVVLSGEWESATALPLHYVQALTVCSGLKTLEEHVTNVSTQLHKAPHEARYILDTLVHARCLLPETHEQRDAPGDGVSSVISAVAIVTADRPAMLRRCLTSYLEHLRAHVRTSVRIIVVDGSRHTPIREINARIAQEHASIYDVEIEYCGRSQQQTLWEQVLDLPPAVNTDAEALEPEIFDGGRLRNIALLLTAGECVLCVDDDTLCRPWVPANALRGIELCGHIDPRTAAFFQTREAALTAGMPCTLDLLGEHEALLGKTLTEIAATAEHGIDVSGACAHILHALRMRGPGRVRLTVAGLAGDRGEYCPYNLLFRPGRPRQAAVTEPDRLDASLSSRESTLVALRPAITDAAHCVLACTGLDNRTVTPPFIPIGRNEDGLFAEMLRRIDKPAFVGHLGCGVVHDSDRPSAYQDGDIRSASETRLADTTRLLIAAWPDAVATPSSEERLRALSAYLLDLADQPPNEFRMVIARAVVDSRCRWLDEAERSANDQPPRSGWKAALDRYRETLFMHMREPEFFAPMELGSGATAADAMSRYQNALAAFARLLQAWPQAWHRAADQRCARINLAEGA